MSSSDNSKSKQNLWQVIKYIIVAMLAGFSETVTYIILVNVLKSQTQTVDWFVFHSAKGVLIAYLVSAVIGQIVSYIVNRKATFKANNNPVAAAIGFSIMVAVIIILQSYFGPILNSRFADFARADFQNETVITLITDYAGKAVMMLVTLIVTFFMNKFVIMRRIEDDKNENAPAAE